MGQAFACNSRRLVVFTGFNVTKPPQPRAPSSSQNETPAMNTFRLSFSSALRSIPRLAILLLTVSVALPGHGAEKVWTGGGLLNGNWTVGANWGGAAPVAGDDLVFPN